MKVLNRDDFKKLLSQKSYPSISIFIPTHKEWNKIDQDKTRLKNNLNKIEKQLLDNGLKQAEINKLLNPARELFEDRDFWENLDEGLAIYSAKDKFETYLLPIDVEEFFAVSDRFYIKQLLPMLNGAGRFYLLALDLKNIKLFEGTRFNLEEVHLKELPKTIEETLKFDDPEKSLQFHTGTSQGAGGRAAVFHGHGHGSMDDKIRKKKILEFFHVVNKNIYNYLKNESAPLILAGVEYLIPLYTEANSYPNLLKDNYVDCNPEDLQKKELHNKTWTVIQPIFYKDLTEAKEKYEQFSGFDRASSNLEEIIKAAFANRIDTLFVNVNEHEWGSFNPDQNEVHLENESKKEDLLDVAAKLTLENNGTIYAVDKDSMPCNKSAAAVFRY